MLKIGTKVHIKEERKQEWWAKEMLKEQLSFSIIDFDKEMLAYRVGYKKQGKDTYFNFSYGNFINLFYCKKYKITLNTRRMYGP